MPGIAFVEIILGLSALYLALSLLCTALAELVASAVGLRARYLNRGIRSLLRGTKLSEEFFLHPLICALQKDRRPGPILRTLTSWLSLPAKDSSAASKAHGLAAALSYLPADLFARALLDILATRPLKAPPNAAALVPLCQVLEAAWTAGGAGVGPALKAVEVEIEANPGLDDDFAAEVAVRRAVFVLTGGDFVGGRPSVAEWFTQSMDRVTGWYKRTTQLTILTIGALLVVSLNADTLSLFGYLSRNGAYRAAIADTAAMIASQPRPGNGPAVAITIPPGVGLAGQEAGVNGLSVVGLLLRVPALPLGWHRQPDAGTEAADARTKVEKMETALQKVQDGISQRKAQSTAAAEGKVGHRKRVLGAMIGAKGLDAENEVAALQKLYQEALIEQCNQIPNEADAERLAAAKSDLDMARRKVKVAEATELILKSETSDKGVEAPGKGEPLGLLVRILRKLAGFALTVAALSLGAPFWFDLLTRFVNIRGAGTKPEAPRSP